MATSGDFQVAIDIFPAAEAGLRRGTLDPTIILTNAGVFPAAEAGLRRGHSIRCPSCVWITGLPGR